MFMLDYRGTCWQCDEQHCIVLLADVDAELSLGVNVVLVSIFRVLASEDEGSVFAPHQAHLDLRTPL